MSTQQEKPHVCLAQIDGQILEYDTADPKGPRPFIYPEGHWQYLGEGVVWSVNGVRQAGKTRLHFWRSKADRRDESESV